MRPLWACLGGSPVSPWFRWVEEYTAEGCALRLLLKPLEAYAVILVHNLQRYIHQLRDPGGADCPQL